MHTQDPPGAGSKTSVRLSLMMPKFSGVSNFQRLPAFNKGGIKIRWTESGKVGIDGHTNAWSNDLMYIKFKNIFGEVGEDHEPDSPTHQIDWDKPVKPVNPISFQTSRTPRSRAVPKRYTENNVDKNGVHTKKLLQDA